MTDKDYFNRLMDFIYKAEGYESNDPKDPGGYTLFGVSTRWWPNDVAKMRTMSKEDAWNYAKDFYYKNFWLSHGCDKIDWPGNICLCDCSINGTGNSKIPANTLWSQSKDWTHFLLKRLRLYGDIKGGDPFLHGHMDRVLNLFDYIESF